MFIHKQDTLTDDVFLSIRQASMIFRIPYLMLKGAAESGELTTAQPGVQYRTTAAWIRDWQQQAAARRAEAQEAERENVEQYLKHSQTEREKKCRTRRKY